MDDDGHTRCRVCGTDFGTYRTYRLHMATSRSCGRKRKLVEDTDENSYGDGGAVDQLLPPNEEGVRVYNREIYSSDRLQRSKAWVWGKFGSEVVTLPLYLGWDGVRFVVWLYKNCAVIVPSLYKSCEKICTNLVKIFVQILYK